MSPGRCAALAVSICALAFVAGCRSAPGPQPLTRPADAPPGVDIFNLDLDRSTLRANGASEAMLAKLDASAFRYFRALAEPSKHRACEAFQDLRWRLPSGPVHGDAHIEQFVVTDDFYGLADFDNAGFGPAIVDLVRYAASLHLACREVPGGCDPEEAVTAYFNAYRAALDRPVRRSQPALVARMRSHLGQEPEAWLRWADDLMQPASAAEEERVRREWFRFVALMRETSPERPESFYRIVRLGLLEMGVGSGLEHKLLVRIAGDTASPADDVILEARPHTLPAYRGCVWRPTGGSLNVFVLTSMLAHPLPEVFGVLPNPAGDDLPEIWIQSWEPGYRELALADLRGQADVNALAADAGTQLAGHFWTTFPEALRGHQRFIQLRAFELTEGRARDVARTLARDVLAAWERFRGRSAGPAH